MHSTFRDVILTQAHPGTLIQLTLQILTTSSSHEDPSSGGIPLQSDSIIPVLPHLVNAGMFAILDANIPSQKICAATGVSLVSQRANASQIIVGSSHEAPVPPHAFVFSSQSEMLLAESEGACNVEQWQECARVAEEACTGVDGSEHTGLLGFMREVVGRKIAARTKWRATL